MNPTQRLFVIFLALLMGVSCDPAKKTAGNSGPLKDDGIFELTILQMNDVYEISPAPSDGRGGLARVATLRKQLLAKNPNTLTVLAGDFISPSVIGTLKHEGKRIRGKQMVEVLNSLGLDMVVFGNHEFDYDDQADLQSRLDESKFTWLTGNVRYKPVPASPEKTTFTQQFFKNIEPGKTEICPDNKVVSLKDRDGTTINLGVFGVLVSSGRKPWAVYSDWVESANKSYADLAPKSDVVIGLTHLNVADDKKLAAMLPQIPLIMGGHDHNNQIHKIGTTTVAKADANAKTVYVHYLRYDKNTKSCTVKSELKKIDPSISEDPQTAEVVAKWEKIKNEALLAVGINAAGIVTKITGAWDCREGTIRSQPAEIGKVITAAMVASAKHQPDCAILNSGSIRVDDVLTGAISELDIVRILPFGGSIVEIEIKGSLLAKTLDAGRLNVGNGGYLQMQGISFDEAGKKWLIAGKPLDINKLYEVVLPEFLLTGNESNMAFLKAGLDATGKSSNPDIPVIHKPDPKDKSDLRNDIRLALIKYLKA